MENVKVGGLAPDFCLNDQDGKEFKLSNQRGKWVVLYFYPKDDTPGCTTEACGFRDLFNDFVNIGAVIYGVSVDDENSHRKFVDKYKLPFPLLSDTEKQVVKSYGVWKEKKMFAKLFFGIERTTFVIDPEGIIRKIYKKVKVANHNVDVLKFIKDEQAKVG